MSRRFAAIDIGTVTCRMLVADVHAGQVEELAKEYAITNLGEDVDRTGVLKPEAMQRVAAALDRYLELRDALASPEHPVKTVAVATSAARDAKNAADFAALLARRGIELAVIPGEREAALSFKGASGCFPGEDVLVVDIGGGSTEVVAGRAGGEVLRARSFNVGCRRVTERFLASDPPAPEELAAARAWVRGEMAGFFEELEAAGFAPERLVAVAGTATSVVSIRERMERYDSTRVHKARVTREDLREAGESLASMTLAQRERVAGLDPRRAPVIVAGLTILDEVVGLAGTDGFTASESDILQGIVLDAAERAQA